MSIQEQLTDSFKLVCYQLVYYAVKCIPARQRRRRLLLVKTDEIGDYVLMRNLLGRFRGSRTYEGYHITFVGNRHWQQLFEAYDAGVADEVIWLDKIGFRRNMLYRFLFLLRIRRAGFSDAVNLIYSRSFRADDLLIAVSTSTNNIAMKAPKAAVRGIERKLTPGRIYHRLVDAGGERLFDGMRNVRFIEAVIEAGAAGTRLGAGLAEAGAAAEGHDDMGKVVSTRLNGHLPEARPEWSLPADFFVVVPGSGNPNKWWPTEYFAETIRYVVRQYRMTPVICGAAGDREVTAPLCVALKGIAVDLTGRTSLTELLAVLRMARFLISIDTGAVHLAAAVGCPVFGLFSGFHYGRFSPYPGGLAQHFFPVYPDETEQQIAGGRLIPEQVPMGLMSRISPEKVIRLLEREIAQIN